jgi:signal peptide peptidase SppA
MFRSSAADGLDNVLTTISDRLKAIFPALDRKSAPIVPIVRLSGTIGRVLPYRPGITLASVAPLLKKAFSMKSAPAVALIVDSPGGSPVQSHLIYKRIRALAVEKRKPVLVFVEDVCASGGYMIACAGDEIIVDPASIVGSIGVVTAGFGFVEAMRKLGVERRVYTSGESKVILDPFQPEKPDDVARLKAIQEEVHDHFIEIVRTRRGDVLAKDRPEIFSGEFWSGRTAVSLGLADRAGDLRAVLRERFGEKVRLKVLSAERSLFMRRNVGVGQPLAAGIAEALIAEAEERAWRERYRL